MPAHLKVEPPASLEATVGEDSLLRCQVAGEKISRWPGGQVVGEKISQESKAWLVVVMTHENRIIGAR